MSTFVKYEVSLLIQAFTVWFWVVENYGHKHSHCFDEIQRVVKYALRCNFRLTCNANV